MHEDLSPPLSASLSPESLSDDDNSIPSESHEGPGALLSGQSEAEVEDTLAEDLQIQDADSDIIHAREYQLEMFEESLKRNIIVAVSGYCYFVVLSGLHALVDGDRHR